MPAKYATVGAHRIHYFHTGTTTLPDLPPALGRGETLVFLHGAGWNASLWQPLMERLADTHSPLAPDFPAHGRSTGTEGPGTVDEYRDCLVGFLDALGVERAVLVGHGLGAATALACAISRAARVRALALTGGAARFRIPSPLLDTWRDVMRGRRPQPFTNEGFAAATGPDVLRTVLAEQVRTDPRVRYRDLAVCDSFEVTPWLPELDVPTLVVNGVEDPWAPPEQAAVLHEGIAGCERVDVEGAGHYVPWEKPAEFEAALRRFLGRVGGRA